MFLIQVLVSKSINLVGRNAVKLVRVPLLSMDEIGQLEIDNEKDSFIPVCHLCYVLKAVWLFVAV